MMANAQGRASDYRISHTVPKKGSTYDEHFRESAWLRHVWREEQRVLAGVIRRHYADRKIAYLDFACGTGRVLEYISQYAETSVGIDVSDEMLQVAERKVTRAEIVRGDLTRDDVLHGRTFNLITAFRFFPNAESSLRREAIQSMVRHLDMNGVLVFNNHENHSSLRYRVARLRGKRWPTMSKSDVQHLLSEVGLRIVESHAMGVFPAVEGHAIVPAIIHRIVDKCTIAVGLGEALGQNIVYVCHR